MKKYLTVKEFFKMAAIENNIIIATSKDNLDGRGKIEICKCNSPVENLEYDENSGVLSWSDDDGDPHFDNLKSEDIMKDISDDGEYFTSCYIEI